MAQLSVGEVSTSPVAWVEVPSLRVLRVAQTYRRLGDVGSTRLRLANAI